MYLKKAEDIAYMRIAGKALSSWLKHAAEATQSGIYKNGQQIQGNFLKQFETPGVPNKYSFPFAGCLNADGEPYGYFICISVADEIVHSRPTFVPFSPGIPITIDAGLNLNGWHSDCATTILSPGKPQQGAEALVSAAKEALQAGIRACKPGNRVSDISTAIWNSASSHGYNVVTDFTGHGIGKQLHEMARIPNKPGILRDENIILRPGLVICLEPMLTIGKSTTVIDIDGWRVFTRDGSLAAHEECQLAITDSGYEILAGINLIGA